MVTDKMFLFQWGVFFILAFLNWYYKPDTYNLYFGILILGLIFLWLGYCQLSNWKIIKTFMNKGC